jgi:O-antigen biosynthesis protein
VRPDRPPVPGGPIELDRPPDPRVSVVVVAWKQDVLLGRCLRSLASHQSSVPFETIVVLNGASDPVRRLVADELSGAVVVDSPTNLGFAGGNQHGAAIARGEHLVLLNDDATVLPGWLDHLVLAADADDAVDVGAVASTVVDADFRVQEAGGVIWSDGTTSVLGRGGSVDDALRAGRRTVDYASACSLLVRRSAWDDVGGLDEGFAPAYYEDVDLCLALRRAGHRVVVEPRSMVVHDESASSTSSFKHFMFRRNHERIVDRWATELAHQPDRASLGDDAVERAGRRLDLRSGLPSVLVIDDRAPRPSGGAGYARMLDTLLELHGAPGVRLVFGAGLHRDRAAEVALAALGIPVVVESLDEHLADPDTHYDLVLLSRPENAERYAGLVRAHHPDAALVYDAEALFHRRLALQAELTDHDDERAAVTERARRFESFESRLRELCDHVISLSTDEAAWFEASPGTGTVSYVPPVAHAWDLAPADWHRRRNAVFVAGWLAGAESPNGDALRWLHDAVLPAALAESPGLQIGVTGGALPGDLRELVGAGIASLGDVDDLDALYASARVAVAPVRYGAGVKIKVVEAIQAGVPVVTTTVGAEGLPGELRDLLVVTDDGEEMGREIARLCTDRAVWARQRLRIEAAARRWAGTEHPSVASVVLDVIARRERRAPIDAPVGAWGP